MTCWTDERPVNGPGRSFYGWSVEAGPRGAMIDWMAVFAAVSASTGRERRRSAIAIAGAPPRPRSTGDTNAYEETEMTYFYILQCLTDHHR